MSTLEGGVLAGQMRRAFDAAFAVAAGGVREQTEQLFAIRVGQQPYALRIADIAGISVAPVVTVVPGAPRELTGVTGHRSVVVAVYDLSVLLGDAPSGSCRWMARVAIDPTIGLAFAGFEGNLDVTEEHDGSSSDSHSAGAHGDIEGHHRLARPIIDVVALVEGIKSVRKPT